jgi:hypothetical protein
MRNMIDGDAARVRSHAETSVRPSTFVVIARGRQGISTAFECPFLSAERRGRKIICEVASFWGRTVDDTVVHLDVLGVINSGGCVHRRKLVE